MRAGYLFLSMLVMAGVTACQQESTSMTTVTPPETTTPSQQATQPEVAAPTTESTAEVVKEIDFNSAAIQAYPPTTGRAGLKEAINKVYFQGKAALENIIITGGSTVGLDISFQVLDMEKIYIPAYYWTTYDQIMLIRHKDSAVYQNYDELFL